MKHPLITLAAALALPASLPAAPLNTGQIPADTKWFIHLDLDGLRQTGTGKDMFAKMEDKHGAQFRAIKRMFSLNPLTDLSSMTLMGPGAKDQAVVLIDGRFDRAHIQDIIAAAKDYTTYPHGQRTVHSWLDEKKGKIQFGSFVSNHLIAISEQKLLLHHALDVLAGKADALAAEPGFNKRGIFFAAWARLADIEMEEQESELLRKAEELRLTAGESNGRIAASMAIDARDRETAQLMRRVLDGIAAFGELAEIVGPEVGMKATLGAGNRVEAVMDAPVDAFLEFVEKQRLLEENKNKPVSKENTKHKDAA